MNKISFFSQNRADQVPLLDQKKLKISGLIPVKRFFDNLRGYLWKPESAPHKKVLKLGVKLKIEPDITDKISQLVLSKFYNTDYQTQLDQLTQEISGEDSQSLQRMALHLKGQSLAQKTVHELLANVKIKEKWLKLGMNPDWLNEHFQEIKFLIQTELIYSILGFQNSTLSGKEENEIKVLALTNGEKGLWIKKEGKWVPVSELKNLLTWDDKQRTLSSVDAPHKRWCYYSNGGLVPIHTEYENNLAQPMSGSQAGLKMYPVTKLSEAEMEELRMHASRFSLENKHPACVLQFVTHPLSNFQQSWMRKMNGLLNIHCGVRLVDANGDVYSFGFGAIKLENDLKKNSGFKKFTTMNGQTKILDYLEFREYEQRLVTNVPISKEQANKILERLNDDRKHYLRFNIIRQNCVRYAAHLLYLIDIPVNVRVSLTRMIWRGLPNLEHLPLIGKPIFPLKKAYLKASQAVAERIPAVVKQVFANLSKIVLYMPKHLATLGFNLILLVMGGKDKSLNLCRSLAKTSEIGQLENFETLLSNNLFDERSTRPYLTSIFIHWQLQQKSTEAYSYSGQPSMTILPPKSTEERNFSIATKALLKDLYQESK